MAYFHGVQNVVYIIKLKLCVFFACGYSSRTDVQIFAKFCMRVPWDQGDILEKLKLRKMLWDSKPCDGSFCILETKHNRRTSPGPKPFDLMRLQEQRHDP